MSLIIYQNVFAVVYFIANMQQCAAGCLFATQWIKEILSTSVAKEYHLTINRVTCKRDLYGSDNVLDCMFPFL